MFNELTGAVYDFARWVFYTIIEIILCLNSPDPKISNDPDPRLTFSVIYTDDAGDSCDALFFFFDEAEWESEQVDVF